MASKTTDPIAGRAAHICVDMQNIFSGDSPWAVPWMDRIVGNVAAFVGEHPRDTIFTRFIPAVRPGGGAGRWAKYYENWKDMTLERLAPGQIDLIPELQPFAAEATVVDKHVYSPWIESGLHGLLRHREVDTLIISGGETEMCVAATVLGAVDLGYRTILMEDGLCSSADETHDAMMTIYRDRLSLQIEVATSADLQRLWPSEKR
jgi:nicotinamidase-related amidase